MFTTAQPSRVGLLAGEVTSAPVSVFPLSLVPTFLVPMSVMPHLIVLRQVVGAPAAAPARLDASRAPSAG